MELISILSNGVLCPADSGSAVSAAQNLPVEPPEPLYMVWGDLANFIALGNFICPSKTWYLYCSLMAKYLPSTLSTESLSILTLPTCRYLQSAAEVPLEHETNINDMGPLIINPLSSFIFHFLVFSDNVIKICGVTVCMKLVFVGSQQLSNKCFPNSS